MRGGVKQFLTSPGLQIRPRRPLSATLPTALY